MNSQHKYECDEFSDPNVRNNYYSIKSYNHCYVLWVWVGD